MHNLLNVPWLIVSVVLYNLIAVVGGFAADPNGHITLHVFQRVIIELPMVSGVYWVFTVGDLVLVFTLGVLFVELIKATRPGTASFVDHALSLVVFIICLLEFILWQRAATSVFFLIMITTLIDVLAGFSISVRAARRDLVMGGGDHLP
jgi:hypothetical protein